MATQEQLTSAADNRTRTLEAIRTSIAERGYPPTVSEVATELRVTKRTVRLYLQRLARDGAIDVDPGVPRGIRLNP